MTEPASNCGNLLKFTERQQNWLLAALPCAMLLAAIIGDSAIDGLGYDRTLIAAGDWWRLLTGHLMHLNAMHMLMNVVALALVWLLLRGAATGVEWLLLFAVIALLVSAGLWVFDSTLMRYVGASGVIHGWVTFGAIRQWPVARLECSVLLVGVIAKLISEWLIGPSATTAALIGGNIITAAHAYGAASGVLLAILWPRRRASLASNSTH